MRSRSIGLACAALLAAVLTTPMAAEAQYYAPPPPPGYYGGYHGRPGGWDDGRYAGPRRYHGRRDRYRRCDRGTGGTIIGAIAGGLLGNTVAGRGDRAVGTVVGAGAGALAGRAIDRDC